MDKQDKFLELHISDHLMYLKGADKWAPNDGQFILECITTRSVFCTACGKKVLYMFFDLEIVYCCRMRLSYLFFVAYRIKFVSAIALNRFRKALLKRILRNCVPKYRESLSCLNSKFCLLELNVTFRDKKVLVTY